jgi:hypothetical protein
MDSEQEPVRDEPARRDAVDRGAEVPGVASATGEGGGAPSSVPSPSRVGPASPEPAAAPAPSRVRARALGFLRESGADVLNLVSLGVLGTAVFLLKLEPISIGGDAIRKWFFVRQWFHANDFSSAKWDHHMARLGVNGIAYLVQLVFGHVGRAYYIAPVSAGVLQVLFVYACGKRLGSRLAGALGALLLIAFPPMHTAASQLLPEVFSGTYAIIAMYLFLRYLDAAAKARVRWLSVLGLALFAGYMAKEATVFFVPGFVVAIWLCRSERRFRDIAILLGILALGVACETAFYRIFTNYAHRFAVVTERHVISGTEPDTDFWGLFNRFDEAVPAWRFVFYTFCGTSLGVVAFARNVRATALVIVAASYLFFLTFLVHSVHPLLLWQAFRSRYLDPAAPFVLLVTGLFLSLCLRELWERHASARWARWAKALPRYGSAILVGVCVLVGYGYHSAARDGFSENPLVTLPKMQAIVTDTYRRNLPVVGARNIEGLHAAFAIMLSDRLLVKKGLLPEFQESKQNGGGKTYVVKYTSVYGGGVLSRILKKHCYVEVVGKDGSFFVRPMKVLPKECDEELLSSDDKPDSADR